MVRRFCCLLGARWVREVFQSAFFIYMARKSPSSYGEFMLALNVGSILLTLTQFGLNQYLVPRVAQESGSPHAVLGRVSLIKGILLLTGWLALSGFLFLQGYSLELKSVVFLIAAGMSLDGLASTYFALLQVQGLQRIEAAIRSISAWLAFGYGLVMLLFDFPAVLVACYKLIDVGIAFLGIVFFLARQGCLRYLRPIAGGIGGIIPQVLYFGLIEVCAIGFNRINVLYLQHYGGAGSIAQYSASWQIVDGIAILVSGLLLQGVVYPVLAGLWKQDKTRAVLLVRKAAGWLMAAGILLVFVLVAERDRIILLVYGSQYFEAIGVQQVVSYTVVCAFLYNLAAYLMMSMGLAGRLLVFYLAGLALNILLCSLLIPSSPLLGAAWSMLLTKAAMAVMLVCYCQKRVGLIPLDSAVRLAACVGGGAALFLLAGEELPRELVEFFALVPLLGLAWNWWRKECAAPNSFGMSSGMGSEEENGGSAGG